MFRADVLLAKHDEKYMPKDVADALKKQGLWKEEYGAGSKDSNTAAARAAQSGQGAMR